MLSRLPPIPAVTSIRAQPPEAGNSSAAASARAHIPHPALLTQTLLAGHRRMAVSVRDQMDDGTASVPTWCRFRLERGMPANFIAFAVMVVLLDCLVVWAALAVGGDADIQS